MTDHNWDSYMPGPSGPPLRSRRPPGYSFKSPNDPSSSPEWVPFEVSSTEFLPLEPDRSWFPDPPPLLPILPQQLRFSSHSVQQHRYLAPPQQILPTPSEEFQKYIDSLKPLTPTENQCDDTMQLPDDLLRSLDLQMYSDAVINFLDNEDDDIKMPLLNDAGLLAAQEFQQCPDIMMSVHVDAVPLPAISQEFQMYPDNTRPEYMKPFPNLVPLRENMMPLFDKIVQACSSHVLLSVSEDGNEMMPGPSTSNDLRDQYKHHEMVPGTTLAVKSDKDKENPRLTRNKNEKQRRDQLNGSITELASLVPSVLSARRRVDKTGVLRLTAHYLRSQQYIFGTVILNDSDFDISMESVMTLLHLFNGFLLTVTYTGLVVVVSPNVNEYLGYSEFDLLGQSIMNITHEDDQQMLREQLMPPAHFLGSRGELVLPDDPEERWKAQAELEGIQKKFTIRFRKNTPRSEAPQYLTCYVEGSLRKADHACDGNQRSGPKVRRARARADNPCASGNDLVFIGMVRPSADTFRRESEMGSNVMEYRTRHSVAGEIIQCDRKISLVAGYLTGEVLGLNAMNFIHKDDVRWVAIALRDMYDQHRVMGESCYRLRMRNGQFVYMWSRGCLVVEPGTHDVTSFLCTNTVVSAAEGRTLNREMKKKFYRMMNNNEEIPEEELKEDDSTIITNHTPQRVEDPRQLKKVIFHMVTNLPSPDPPLDAPGCSTSSDQPRLSIIPPDPERIISAIDKIYSVISDFGNPSTSPTKTTNGSANVVEDLNPTNRSADEDIAPPKAKIAKYKEEKAATPPKLQTFEEAFINQKEDKKNGRFVFKVSDQVLGAVQLVAGASGKRKLFEPTVYKSAGGVEEMPTECFEFRSLLGNNGAEHSLFPPAAEMPGRNQDDLPDVLLDPVFQELLNDLGQDQDIEEDEDEKESSF